MERLLTDPHTFASLVSDNQCKSLLRDAQEALTLVPSIPPKFLQEARSALDIAERVAGGETSLLPELIRTVNDVDTENDFPTWAGLVGHDTDIAAALDIGGYACGFVARIVAERTGYDLLPDPVIEARPEYRDYFVAQLERLRLAAR
ncbi:hypothetical protein GCM10011360_41800 [Primorskyibacter flagellatus]|uniref:Uncharacterized protein n=1 Tax=Primorskyibacter flagellatus TaxID=1387277 RepID=A0A917AGZ9_9RHOB|nr:hypothetical protein [Primorskyibacter flagellatus]GGE50358.1 hypothetical protein GCM10011360_41800 [Primorskyibacter flagellatus]